MTNLYYNTIKMLLERVSSVMIDQEALKVLLTLVEGALDYDSEVLDSLNLTADIAMEKGLKLLFVSMGGRKGLYSCLFSFSVSLLFHLICVCSCLRKGTKFALCQYAGKGKSCILVCLVSDSFFQFLFILFICFLCSCH